MRIIFVVCFVFLTPGEFSGSNLSHQAWRQVPLPPGSSLWPLFVCLLVLLACFYVYDCFVCMVLFGLVGWLFCSSCCCFVLFLHTMYVTAAYRGQKRASSLLSLELQKAVSYDVGAGT